jgi:hypothetical protein
MGRTGRPNLIHCSPHGARDGGGSGAAARMSGPTQAVARQSSTRTGGTCGQGSRWGTRCSSTRRTRRSPPCFPRAGWAPSRSSRAEAPNTYRLDIQAVWHTCQEFNVESLSPFPCRRAVLGGEPPLPPLWRRLMAHWSTSFRSCSSPRCSTAGLTSWSAGLAATPQPTRGSRWTTSPTARPSQAPPSSGRPVAPGPTPSSARTARPGQGCHGPARAGRLCSRGSSVRGLRRGAGGLDDPLLVADGRVAARATVRAGPSRTWPTPGKPRRCAAQQTRCSTPPPTASAGCCSPGSPAAAAAGVSRDPPAGPGRRPLASVRVFTPQP